MTDVSEPTPPLVPKRAWASLRPLGIVTVMVCLMALLSYWLVLLPSRQELLGARQAYHKERKISRDLARDRLIQEEVFQQERLVNDIWNIFPTEGKFSAMAVAISKLAYSEHIDIPGMSYSHQPVLEGLPQKATLSFTATGPYMSIYRFIYRLERMDPYLSIDRLDAAQTLSSSASGRESIQVSIQVTTFLRKELGERGES